MSIIQNITNVLQYCEVQILKEQDIGRYVRDKHTCRGPHAFADALIHSSTKEIIVQFDSFFRPVVLDLLLTMTQTRFDSDACHCHQMMLQSQIVLYCALLGDSNLFTFKCCHIEFQTHLICPGFCYRLVDPDEEAKRSGYWRFNKKSGDDETDEDKRSGFYRFNREPILRGDLNPENFNKKGKMPKLRFGEKRSFDRGELYEYLQNMGGDKRSGYWRFNKRLLDGSDDEDMEKKSARWRFAKRDDSDEDKRSGYWRFNKREDDDGNELETDDKRSGYWRFNKRGDEDDDKRSGFYRFNKKNTADKYNARWTFGEEDKKRSGFYRFNKRDLEEDEEKRSGFYRFNKKDNTDEIDTVKRAAPADESKVADEKEE